MNKWHLSEKQLNTIIDDKIKAHELKVGFVSGIIGMVFCGAIIYTFAVVFSKLP